MNRKKIKIMKLMLGLALTLILSLSLAAPAFASEDPPEGDYSQSGNDGESATAAITKLLRIAEGTDTPVETFYFTLTATSEPWGIATATVGETPSVGTVTIGFDGNDTSTPAGGVVSLYKQSTDIFADVKWPHAGVYVYSLVETDKETDGMTYSKAEYHVYVYVVNDGEGGLYVDGISARIVDPDDSNAVGSEAGAKVDPTPGGSDGDGFSQLIFTNTYVVPIDEEDPTDPSKHILSISKTVEGEYGDLTKYFAFDLMINQPSTLEEVYTYRAYVLEGDAVVGFTNTTSKDNNSAFVTPPSNEPSESDFGPYILVKAGEPITIYLKHGQQLVFTALHYGASYEVEEQGATGYTASVTVVVDGGTPKTLTATNAGDSLSTAFTDPVEEQFHIIGTGKNSAAFTNTFKTISPTGISVDNLPYVILIVIALLALIVFVAFRTHRNAKYGKYDR